MLEYEQLIVFCVKHLLMRSRFRDKLACDLLKENANRVQWLLYGTNILKLPYKRTGLLTSSCLSVL